MIFLFFWRPTWFSLYDQSAQYFLATPISHGSGPDLTLIQAFVAAIDLQVHVLFLSSLCLIDILSGFYGISALSADPRGFFILNEI